MPEEIRTVEFWPGHPVSYTTTKLGLFFNEQPLGVGTGFVVNFARQYFLVTSLHVLSGKSPIDGTCLSKTGGLPNIVHFHVALVKHWKRNGRAAETIFFKPIVLDLYREEFENPVWFDEKDQDNQSDYCAIPLADIVTELNQPNYSLRAITAGNVTLKRGVKESLKVRPGEINHYYPAIGHQVFIVGYPAGISPSGVFPIWKGGTIASEPLSGLTLSGVENEDVFLVDGLTRSGLSGSPVICLQKPGDKYYTDDGLLIKAKKEEPLLIGVYAGREGVTSSEADLALGRVWKVGALERLLREVAISSPQLAGHKA